MYHVDCYFEMFRRIGTGLVVQVYRDLQSNDDASSKAARVAAEKLLAMEFGPNWQGEIDLIASGGIVGDIDPRVSP